MTTGFIAISLLALSFYAVTELRRVYRSVPRSNLDFDFA